MISINSKVKDEPEPVEYIYYQQLPQQSTHTHCGSEMPQNKQTRKTPPSEPSYQWNETEKLRYLMFLSQKRSLFALPLKQRKRKRIHYLLSKMVKTRSAIQCRSHHQKMLSKFGSIAEILEANRHQLEMGSSKASKAKDDGPLKVSGRKLTSCDQDAEFVNSGTLKEEEESLSIAPAFSSH
jgi:hypothetical protein